MLRFAKLIPVLAGLLEKFALVLLSPAPNPAPTKNLNAIKKCKQ